MFQTFIVQPLFNLLVTIYAILPGHNFGIALIVFTIIIRILLWPLVKKQLHQTKVMRKLQPELKRIKAESGGDRQKESMKMLELYKAKGVNPLGSLPILIVQMVILIGLYSGLSKLMKEPSQIYDFAYGFLQNTSFLKTIAANIHNFDNTLIGLVDLARPAIGPKGFYLPAFLLVIGSAFMQFIVSKQILPTAGETPRFKDILKSAGEGKPADQADVNAAVGRMTVYIIPAMVLLFTINLAAALSLYWLVGSIVAYFQQKAALRDDTEEMEELAGKSGSKITIRQNGDAAESKRTKDVSKIQEAEVISSSSNPSKTNTPTKKKSRKKRKRR